MADVERRTIGGLARHAATSVLLVSIFSVAGASVLAYLWLVRSQSQELSPVARQVAQLSFVDGTARVKRADANEFLVAGEGAALGPGDAVQTLDGSRALLRFLDGSSYQLDPGVTIVLRDSAAADAALSVPTLLSQGRVATTRPTPDIPAVRAEHRLATMTGDASNVRRRIVLGTTDPAPRSDQLLKR